MASTSIQNVSRGKYDVFLSFRGEDTRKSFTDHLYAALKNKGIYVFRDDKELERGGSIPPGLLKAIEESRISIIVLSKNYASSTWCLDELDKIVECKNREDLIFPIFYDVEPTVVRKQAVTFGEAFAKHEEIFKDNMEKVGRWRDALKVVANKSGWELKDSNESEFIEEIVNVISSKIRAEPEILKELVGIDSRLDKLRFLTGTGSNDVRMIGMWGMGGLGKTTLARVLFEKISHEFDGSSFLANVREKSEKEGSVISLQKQLLSDVLKLADTSIWNVDDVTKIIGSRLRQKKVLLVIDDVVHVEQLRILAGKRDWYGLGSRIIITTRDEHLLMLHRVNEVYKLEALTFVEAFQLFCSKAFDPYNKSSEEYREPAVSVVKYASGLPLALNVLGSFFFGRPVDEWRSALSRLKRNPETEILDVLQISFDGLTELEKKIFLDIACFFKGQKRDYVTEVLNGCDFDPVIGIAVLIEKSLLTVDDTNRLWMHDLLEEMGRQIVRRQSPEEPGKRSRLWEEADVRHVMLQNTGSEVVEGIMVNKYLTENKVDFSASANAFLKMTNLRLLKIGNLQLPEGLKYLSNKLRLLDWGLYPLKSLPSNLQLDKTVEFKMCYSRIEELWKGTRSLNMLKVMRLNYSRSLIKTPDFTKVLNLEELDLEGCTRLREIHPSLLEHEKLILLNLRGCTSLATFPGKIYMKSLKTLILSGCLKLKKFPDIAGSMKCLQELLLDGTDIKELPESIGLLSGLDLLTLNGCKNLERLPSTISAVKCLSTLNLSGFSKFREFPEIMASMEQLLELHLVGTAIRGLPASIELLSGLVLLNLKDCKNLQSLPSTINGLRSLQTLYLSGCSKLKYVPENLWKVESLEVHDISGTAIRKPPSSIFLMKNLEELSCRGCKGSLSSTSWFLRFPINLMRRNSDPVALSLPSSLSGFCSLTKLDISDCNLGEGAIPRDIGNLSSLKVLYLSRNSFVSLPASICRLSNLWKIELEDCKMLQSLPRLPANILSISLDGCISLKTLSDVIKLNEHRLPDLRIKCMDCLKLPGNHDLALSLLKEYIKHFQNMSLSNKFLEQYAVSDGRCSIVVPGSEIPEWFQYQNNERSSIRISTPPKTYKNSKDMLCAVFFMPINIQFLIMHGRFHIPYIS